MTNDNDSLSVTGEKMNELDALRQEAETLKNAIRVSCASPAFNLNISLIITHTICNVEYVYFRMLEKQHATPAWCRRRIIWNQLGAFKCEQDAHYVVI